MVIELVVVLMILGVLFAAAVPQYHQSLLIHRVESAARRVQADIELVRRTAMYLSSSQTITFGENCTYKLSPDIDALDHPAAEYAVDLTQPPFNLQSLVADFGDSSTLTFNGYGIPSAGGEIVLTLGSQQRSVLVHSVTGYVTIE